MIVNGEVDLAIISQNALGPEISFLPLYKTPLVGVTPKEYQPLNGTSITMEDFKANDLIAPYEGYDTEKQKSEVNKVRQYFQIKIVQEIGMACCL